jgi:hypothetical protein
VSRPRLGIQVCQFIMNYADESVIVGLLPTSVYFPVYLCSDSIIKFLFVCSLV